MLDLSAEGPAKADAGYWMLDAGCWILDAGCCGLGLPIAWAMA